MKKLRRLGFEARLNRQARLHAQGDVQARGAERARGDIDISLLKEILRQAGISDEDYMKA
ncbi:MAG: hypothetical protein M5T61_21640 [Acidimicrobiia bacterium]|nr:hypothetical protein [Acidimicrobiia bacterium]